MLRLALATHPIRRVLAIGCHADDIEIGCGGTILRILRDMPGVQVTWVVLTAEGVRREEAEASARAFLTNAAATDIRIPGFRESFLPYSAAEVKEFFETLKDVEPDLILTHTRDDLHQDHRLACQLTWNTFRDDLILEYEIPKYDGDLGAPNVFVALDEALMTSKLRLLEEHFVSQASKHWFDAEYFRSMARIRGAESAVRYAEAFFGRKVLI
jgi:LmbE family N-acetylglucosaminyl deacetylase